MFLTVNGGGGKKSIGKKTSEYCSVQLFEYLFYMRLFSNS